jgi:hypothetical protein
MTQPSEDPPGEAQPPDNPLTNWLSPVELDNLVGRRHSARRRYLQTVLVLLTLLVVVGAVLVSNVPGRLQHLAGSPTATSPVVVDGPVLLLSNASYGIVRLNGRALTGSPPLVVALARGDNTITLDAPPFRTRTCHIYWPDPESLTGSCVIWSLLSASISVRDQIVDPGLIITLLLGDNDLPAAMQVAVHGAITQALSQVHLHTTVRPDEYVATGRDNTGAITSIRAATPLEADATFALPSGQDVITPAPCGSALCAALSPGGGVGAVAQQQWIVQVRATLSWSFVGIDQPLLRSADYLPALSSLWVIRIALTYDRFSGWQVAPGSTQAFGGPELEQDLGRALCGAGVNELLLVARSRGDLLSSYDTHGVEGCTIELKTSTDGMSDGRFIWRFGVLLAADARAHAALPALPLAPPEEIAAAGG